MQDLPLTPPSHPQTHIHTHPPFLFSVCHTELVVIVNFQMSLPSSHQGRILSCPQRILWCPACSRCSQSFLEGMQHFPWAELYLGQKPTHRKGHYLWLLKNIWANLFLFILSWVFCYLELKTFWQSINDGVQVRISDRLLFKNIHSIFTPSHSSRLPYSLSLSPAMTLALASGM